MTTYQRLIVYLRDGRVLSARHPSKDMDFYVQEAKKLPDYLECRIELA